ncbi:hypothetical protein B9Z55_023233 [Caenorhabditis nigoni]|uniref:CUB domain-containing protein n=1 Tax=Caenorhabditis nigoni TaxID=1611254 RepID=A0A2G5SNR4_9PELO|nr:hypothetical protein B9Z55_023233 [Caenorhabditis nigoni]
MKKCVWIILILLFLFPVPIVSESSKIHLENESTGSGSFECVDGGCSIRIEPSPTKGTVLNLQGNGNKVLVYIITTGRTQLEFLQKESERTDQRSYLADVNQGFLINCKAICNAHTGLPHYSFNREILDSHNCGPYLRYIGNEVVRIQQKRRVTVYGQRFTCQYHMVPFNSNISSETIYVISEASNTFDVFDGNNESYNKTGHIVSQSYWESVEFEQQYRGPNWSRDMKSIYAVTTKRSCVCQNQPVEVSNGQVIHIQSPGYPDFMCPSSQCEKHITFSKFNGSDEYIQRALVTLEARAKVETDFSLVSKNFDVRFNADMYSNVSTHFLLEPVDKVTHNTPLSLYNGPEGHFNMSIQSIQIRKDCDCSLFKQKKYERYEHKIKIKVPAQCELIFCHWTIGSGGYKEIIVKVDKVRENDEVHIWNRNITEKYNSTQLKQPRKLYSAVSVGDTFVFFRRNTSGVSQQNYPSFITVSWITAFISPNYPKPYNFFGNCQTLLVAPDNYYIKLNVSDFDVEHIHDHLSFYDGNNTSSEFLLEQLTGTHQNLTFTSSGNMMTVDFFSDGSHGRRGYHFVALAVIISTPKSIEVAIPSMKENDSGKNGKPTPIMDQFPSDDSLIDPLWLSDSENSTTSKTSNLQRSCSKHGFFFYLFCALCAVFITIGTLFGGFVLYKKLNPRKTETSFANEMIRFRNDDTGSVVTIEN